ncbi:hydroxyurea phosphotransferase, partial [Streptomyces sp. NPDC048611]
FDLSEVRYRFDLMTEVLSLDRQRAAAWTLGRALQNLLWNIADGEDALEQEQLAIARLLLER